MRGTQSFQGAMFTTYLSLEERVPAAYTGSGQACFVSWC